MTAKGSAKDSAHYITYLRNMAVSVSIGIHDFEQKALQPVLVSVALFVRRPQRAGDELAEVQDYDFVRDGILALVKVGHFNLQETLCREILALCVAQDAVVGAVVRTEKTTVYPDAEGVGCKMARFKDPLLEAMPWWLLDL